MRRAAAEAASTTPPYRAKALLPRIPVEAVEAVVVTGQDRTRALGLGLAPDPVLAPDLDLIPGLDLIPAPGPARTPCRHRRLLHRPVGDGVGDGMTTPSGMPRQWASWRERPRLSSPVRRSPIRS
ncbi:hypothetical protein NTCA1_01410 [Novosphingobium sp. TCA1]|nr:hypothetical protein NTCA1_01410 [Novosphingobium sp. TCA1]